MVGTKNILRVSLTMTLLATLCLAQAPLPQAPQVRARDHVVSLTLHAVNQDGRDAFATLHGGTVPPVIRASPGDIIKITYVNDLPAKSTESCAVGPCMNMTNLH